jgi:hypothetical protein
MIDEIVGAQAETVNSGLPIMIDEHSMVSPSVGGATSGGDVESGIASLLVVAVECD